RLRVLRSEEERAKKPSIAGRLRGVPRAACARLREAHHEPCPPQKGTCREPRPPQRGTRRAPRPPQRKALRGGVSPRYAAPSRASRLLVRGEALDGFLQPLRVRVPGERGGEHGARFLLRAGLPERLGPVRGNLRIVRELIRALQVV